jgi:hypothetical protein
MPANGCSVRPVEGEMIHVQVSNQGLALNIWSRSSTSSIASAVTVTGTGLGLSICKGNQAMAKDIWAEMSAMGWLSIFNCRSFGMEPSRRQLPMDQANEQRAAHPRHR